MDHITVGLLQACHVGYNAWLDEAREASRPERMHEPETLFGAACNEGTVIHQGASGQRETSINAMPKVRRFPGPNRTTHLFIVGAASLEPFPLELFPGNPT